MQRSLGWHTDDNEETDEWMRDPKALAKVCMHAELCMYVCMVTRIARVWINRVRLPVLHVVS